jgi:SnoaL-like domain
VDVVRAFNAAINDRDVDSLAALMTATHRFVDADGGTVVGKAACVEAWRGFFAAFPDYRNIFETLTDDGHGVVTVGGRSVCSVAVLDGPARWRAEVIGALVDEWRVTDVDALAAPT